MKQKAKNLKSVPQFRSEDEERKFWEKTDSSDYFDWSKAQHVTFPNLKMTKRPISLRVTTSLLAKVKTIANKRDMPYQTLMKQYIAEGVERSFKPSI